MWRVLANSNSSFSQHQKRIIWVVYLCRCWIIEMKWFVQVAKNCNLDEKTITKRSIEYLLLCAVFNHTSCYLRFTFYRIFVEWKNRKQVIVYRKSLSSRQLSEFKNFIQLKRMNEVYFNFCRKVHCEGDNFLHSSQLFFLIQNR